MSVKAATTNVLCKQLEYTIVQWLRGVTPYEWRSQALADPAVSRATSRRDPHQGTLKIENSADLGQYFLGAANIR